MGLVELRVRDEGEEILVYTFRAIADAAEMIHFLSGFLPRAQFVLQPAPH